MICHDEVVELLLERTSAEFINKADNDGDYPLTMAAKGGHERAVKVLLQHPGIDIEKRDSRARTALEWAMKMDNDKITKMLEDKASS